MHVLKFLPFLLPTALASLEVAQRSTTACNNSPSLCSKTYGQITHLGAHDSPFVRDSTTDYSTFGNQYYNTTVQLSAGVRLVTGQVHKNNNEWHLCHSGCDYLDAGTLESWLSEIKTWLDNNPNEVVTVLLVNSDDASASDLNTVFKAANITSYAYTPSSTGAVATWPTLQELISSGTRLMTFIASLSDNTGATYLMDEFTYIWENPYDVTSASNFSCKPDRPSDVQGNTAAALSSHRLPFMNHFLDQEIGIGGIEIPDVGAISTTNGQNGTGNLLTAADTCKSAYSNRQPTFILVDFFDKGPAIDVVDKLNNVTDATGRTAVPNTNSADTSGTTTSGGTFVGLTDLVNEAKTGANPSLGNWIWVGGDWVTIFGGGISI
ncbi:PLC-like phosphodiesterase [Talaromyces proteolyticus]|uniref:PLC-like phosphodiesterase n=1 Tax=Talaromyces proteolyticus TaxID=1131652 RepID=A0AAD4Q2Z5_9EURO|nr:PLC-like phosphodiesterase [Talaromyces proteolyticus]KAH8704177.1 PLC-like phosphodiesterase [Talaromyces proteolyticus]